MTRNEWIGKKGGRRRVQAGAVATWILVLGLVGMGSVQAPAQALRDVTYVGGSSLAGNGLHGRVSVSSVDALVFEGPSKLVIPYDHVMSYESNKRRKVRVGLLTEGIWRLLAPWPEAKQVTLSYRDPEEHAQVVVFEMSRGDEALLVKVLNGRVPRSTERQTIPLLRPPVIGR